ncbi:Spo0E family sporulation regulatory protein-aspartic acid phosphatase [Rossellomorea sp. NPDC077527]|uniref:Spo0E family sporulation regulatory protein-aspartic acid phosphatase n=1 Tax=Rossellomorea sp. NPDC077527 TaxID=3364510 RepID=UPI0037C7C9E5
MKMNIAYVTVEKYRQRMMKTVNIYGLSSSKSIESSQKLDKVLNLFHHKKLENY